MKVDAVAKLEASGQGSWHSFIRHFLEMVVAMIAGMAVLGGALSLIFALAGHSNPIHYAGLRALVMTINMTIGMSLWMRYRGHGWRRTGEMAGAMFLPLLALIGPYGWVAVTWRSTPRHAFPDAPMHGHCDAPPPGRVRTEPSGPFIRSATAPSARSGGIKACGWQNGMLRGLLSHGRP